MPRNLRKVLIVVILLVLLGLLWRVIFPPNALHPVAAPPAGALQGARLSLPLAPSHPSPEEALSMIGQQRASAAQAEAYDAQHPPSHAPNPVTPAEQRGGIGINVDGHWYRDYSMDDGPIRQLRNGVDQNIYVYDQAQHRMLFSYPFLHYVSNDIATRLLQSGTRFLLLGVSGHSQAVVLEQGRALAAFGDASSQWQLSEDNSVWEVQGATLRVLQWRHGAPALRSFPLPGDDLRTLPEGIAVARDGALIAYAIRPRKRDMLRVQRELILLHNGHRAGYSDFTRDGPIAWDSVSHDNEQIVMSSSPIYYEKIGFTPDAAYLYWGFISRKADGPGAFSREQWFSIQF